MLGLSLSTINSFSIFTPSLHCSKSETKVSLSNPFVGRKGSVFLQENPRFVNMEDRKERNAPWLSVPQFGDWDQKGALPDYSMDFSKIRQMRMQNKKDLSRASLGNEEELIPSTTRNSNVVRNDNLHDYHNYHQNHSPTGRRSIFSYFNCCVKA